MKKLRASVVAARSLISPTVFADKPGHGRIKTIMIPIADNGWAPAMWCGEFAMVDVSDRSPRPDEFFLVKHDGQHGSLAIVRPRIHMRSQGRIEGMKDKPEYVSDGNGGWHWEGQFWWLMYGAQSATDIYGQQLDPDEFLSRFHMSDGPLADIHLRQKIVGRVTGVLGHEGRTMNWRQWI